MNPELDGLTDYEMDCITRVFRSFETGLRQATILPKVKILKTRTTTSLSRCLLPVLTLYWD